MPANITTQDLLNAKDRSGRTALHVAFKSGNLPADCTIGDLAAAKDERGWTPLHEAARNGYLNNIRGGVTVSQLGQAKANDGQSALHIAMKYDSFSNISDEITVEKLAAVSDEAGYTALHSAVYNCRLDRVKGKLTADQLLSVCNKSGISALSLISSQISLLEGGATFEQLATARGSFGNTPVNTLAELGELNLICGGVTAKQLRSQKPDKYDDALLVALSCCPLDQIKGGVLPGMVSIAELNKALTTTLQFDGRNAQELITLGADKNLVLSAIREASSNILNQKAGYGDQTVRIRMLLGLGHALNLALEEHIDPEVSALLM